MKQNSNITLDTIVTGVDNTVELDNKVDVPQASSIGFSESASRRSSVCSATTDYTILIAKASKDVKMSASLAEMSFSEVQSATTDQTKTAAIEKTRSCISSGLSAQRYLEHLHEAQQLSKSREALDQPQSMPANFNWPQIDQHKLLQQQYVQEQQEQVQLMQQHQYMMQQQLGGNNHPLNVKDLQVHMMQVQHMQQQMQAGIGFENSSMSHADQVQALQMQQLQAQQMHAQQLHAQQMKAQQMQPKQMIQAQQMQPKQMIQGQQMQPKNMVQAQPSQAQQPQAKQMQSQQMQAQQMQAQQMQTKQMIQAQPSQAQQMQGQQMQAQQIQAQQMQAQQLQAQQMQAQQMKAQQVFAQQMMNQGGHGQMQTNIDGEDELTIARHLQAQIQLQQAQQLAELEKRAQQIQ